MQTGMMISSASRLGTRCALLLCSRRQLVIELFLIFSTGIFRDSHEIEISIGTDDKWLGNALNTLIVVGHSS